MKTQNQITIIITDDEQKALDQLASMQELTANGVMRQALRLYQLVTLGEAKVVFPSAELLKMPICAGNCGEVHTCAACKTEYCNLCREYVHAKCPKGEKP